MLDPLLDKRLIFVTGKGGVGKSTVTAALGKALASTGRRTLVLETDTFSAMEDLYGYQGKGLTPTEISPTLSAANLTAEDCFVATLTRFVPGERVARAVINNRVARVFFKAAPSVNEVTILDQIRVFYEAEDAGKPRYDHIIVDLPASGHAVTFLNVPATMNGMMRGIGPIAKMTAQVAELVNDASLTAIVAVCLPEEMPVNETIELATNLRQVLGRPLTLALANMVHRAPLHDDDRPLFDALLTRVRAESPRTSSLLFDEEPTDERDALARLVEGNALALGWHDRDQRYLGELRQRVNVPVVELPIFYEGAGTDVVNRVADQLTGGDSSTPEPLAL
ncbi:hypothetical protein DL240_12475 [Lujinxingia litoralis]|uniref:ArsA/GET3 Anion-transporting ATPase-like domain-containing protein n=1 Tax=Lujinxingia litoralis TaxID=2211119 RepID=A0A328C4Z7_9DELT|nr:ArsA family ATPase [Lujinxingia litoralis]RAL21665.1 hypothetical protein DL240_12475 [Lujinxingia litoralis]